MKRAEFEEILAKKHDLPKKVMTEVIDGFWELIVKAMKKGDEVVFAYGKFEVKKKPKREARNPATGATIIVPAKVVPQFKANKKFKDEFIK